VRAGGRTWLIVRSNGLPLNGAQCDTKPIRNQIRATIMLSQPLPARLWKSQSDIYWHETERKKCVYRAGIRRFIHLSIMNIDTAPARLLSDTGIDALTHAIEAIWVQNAGCLPSTFRLSAMGNCPQFCVSGNNPSNRMPKEKIMLEQTWLVGLF